MRRSRCLALLAAAVVVLAPAGARAGMFFPLRFDITPDDGEIDPYPEYRGGYGYLSIDDDLPDGRYRIDSLRNMAFSFTIGPRTWTSGDYLSYLPTTEVVIHDSGHRFYFDGPPLPGPESISGSLVVYDKYFLIFQPYRFGPPSHPNTYSAEAFGLWEIWGNYGPPPALPGAPAPLPLLGAVAAFRCSRRLRRRLRHERSRHLS